MLPVGADIGQIDGFCPVHSRDGAQALSMTAPDDNFAAALAQYRAGRVNETRQICEAILVARPHDAAALHLLGVAMDAQGEWLRASELISQALAIRETAQFRSNHGMVLGHRGLHGAEGPSVRKRTLAYCTQC